MNKYKRTIKAVQTEWHEDIEPIAISAEVSDSLELIIKLKTDAELKYPNIASKLRFLNYKTLETLKNVSLSSDGKLITWEDIDESIEIPYLVMYLCGS